MERYVGQVSRSLAVRVSGVIAAVGVAIGFPPTLSAENWPSFRGPTGMGVSTERGLPTTWDIKTGKNILWKVPLRPTVARGKADHNQSSPIVWGDRAIVCTVIWPEGRSSKDVPEQHVTCYDVATGADVWNTPVPAGPWKLDDLRGGYGAPTPATDGERIYAAFGSATLAALDMTGKILWQKDIEDSRSIDVAFASSPVVFEGRVLLLCDKNNKHSTLTAYDGKSGEVTWSRKRPDVAFNHSTPTFATIDGKVQMLVAASNALQGIHPASGEILWSIATPGDVTSPVFHEGRVYSDSGRGGPGVCVEPKGNVKEPHVKWRVSQIPEGLSSPVVAGGLLFRTHSPGVLKCVNWDDGETAFSARLQGVSTQASPMVTGDGLVYFASGGRSIVLRPGKALDIVATNELGDPCAASPAVSGGRLFIKGGRYLYCIGGRKPRP
jgi:outer membrane protein assembly factor BamB